MSSRSSNKTPSVAPVTEGSNLSDQIANLLKQKGSATTNNNAGEAKTATENASEPQQQQQQLPPLPPDWAEKREPKSGKIYYFNKSTKQTSWKRPTIQPAAPAAATASAPVDENAKKDEENEKQKKQQVENTNDQQTSANVENVERAASADENNNNGNNRTESSQQQNVRSDSSPNHQTKQRSVSNNNNNNNNQNDLLTRAEFPKVTCLVKLSSISIATATTAPTVALAVDVPSAQNEEVAAAKQPTTSFQHSYDILAIASIEENDQNTLVIFDFASANSAFAFIDLSQCSARRGSTSSVVIFENVRAEEDGQENGVETRITTTITLELLPTSSSSNNTLHFIQNVEIKATHHQQGQADLLFLSNGTPVANLFSISSSSSSGSSSSPNEQQELGSEEEQQQRFVAALKTAAKERLLSSGGSFVQSPLVFGGASLLLDSIFEQNIAAKTDLLTSAAASIISAFDAQLRQAREQLLQERDAAAQREKAASESNPFDRFVASLTTQYMHEFQKFQQQSDDLQKSFHSEARRLTNLVSQKAHQDELLTASAPTHDAGIDEHIRHRRTLEEAFKSLQLMHHETCDELESTRKKMFELRSELAETQKISRHALEKERDRSQAAIRNVQQDASDHMKHLAANVDVMREKHTGELDAIRTSHEEAMTVITKKLQIAELKMLRAVEETEKAKFQQTQRSLEDRQQIASLQRTTAAVELSVKELRKQLEDKTNQVADYEADVQRAVDRRAAAELTRFKRLMIERTLGSAASQSNTAVLTGRQTPRTAQHHSITTARGGNNGSVNQSFIGGGESNIINNNQSFISENNNNNGVNANLQMLSSGGNELYNAFAKGGSTPRGSHLVRAMKDTSEAVALLSPRSDSRESPLVVANMTANNNNNNNNSSGRYIPRLNFNSSASNNNNNNVSISTRTPRVYTGRNNNNSYSGTTRGNSLSGVDNNNNNSYFDEDGNNNNQQQQYSSESETFKKLMQISGHLKDRLNSLGGSESNAIGGGLSRNSPTNNNNNNIVRR